jgi:methylated-DNA-[protein]-cysteine S-methyltransferase
MTRAINVAINVIRCELSTPIGTLFIFEKEGAVCALGFCEQAASLLERLQRRFGSLQLSDGDAANAPALRAYLAGELAALERVRVDTGGTPFQERVWAALRRIPAGATASYGEIARAVGSPPAVRAVGRANALNPVSLVIPCHRVVRSDGELCGYAGGLARKRWLLEHEASVA